MTTRMTMRNSPALLAGIALMFMTLAVVPQPTRAAGGVTDSNVAEKSAVAKTPADHEALVAYFTMKAGEAAAKVELHEKMRARAMGKSRIRMNTHCRSLIRAARSEQETYEDMADLHKELAEEAHK